MSALTRMAFSDHRKVEVTKDDLIIISATPIPGNEKSVSNVVNELFKIGVALIIIRSSFVTSTFLWSEKAILVRALIGSPC